MDRAPWKIRSYTASEHARFFRERIVTDDYFCSGILQAVFHFRSDERVTESLSTWYTNPDERYQDVAERIFYTNHQPLPVISQNASNVDENKNQAEVENLNCQIDAEQGKWERNQAT